MSEKRTKQASAETSAGEFDFCTLALMAIAALSPTAQHGGAPGVSQLWLWRRSAKASYGPRGWDHALPAQRPHLSAHAGFTVLVLAIAHATTTMLLMLRYHTSRLAGNQVKTWGGPWKREVPPD